MTIIIYWRNNFILTTCWNDILDIMDIKYIIKFNFTSFFSFFFNVATRKLTIRYVVHTMLLMSSSDPDCFWCVCLRQVPLESRLPVMRPLTVPFARVPSQGSTLGSLYGDGCPFWCNWPASAFLHWLVMLFVSSISLHTRVLSHARAHTMSMRALLLFLALTILFCGSVCPFLC